MPSNKFTNEKQELIDSILRKQSSSNRRTPSVPSQPRQTVPNQVTLPSGDTVSIPSYSSSIKKSSPSVSTRSEFDVCCHPDGHEDNLVYHQADWCFIDSTFILDYFFIIGTIYIDGVPSTNPLSCTDGVTDESNIENCIYSFRADNHNPTWPNYGMYGWNDPTGNADAIAAMWNGTIVGFEFINNMNQGTVPIEGVSLNMQSQQSWMGVDCYPNIGDTIDDLLLWKASTDTYYQLTEESYNLFINAVEPIGGIYNYMIDDLYFEPLDDTIDAHPAQCRYDVDCRPGSICYRGKCILAGVTALPTEDCSCECLPDGNCNYCESANTHEDPEYVCTLGQGINWCSWECGGRTTAVSKRVAKTISPPKPALTTGQQPTSLIRDGNDRTDCTTVGLEDCMCGTGCYHQTTPQCIACLDGCPHPDIEHTPVNPDGCYWFPKYTCREAEEELNNIMTDTSYQPSCITDDFDFSGCLDILRASLQCKINEALADAQGRFKQDMLEYAEAEGMMHCNADVWGPHQHYENIPCWCTYDPSDPWWIGDEENFGCSTSPLWLAGGYSPCPFEVGTCGCNGSICVPYEDEPTVEETQACQALENPYNDCVFLLAEIPPEVFYFFELPYMSIPQIYVGLNYLNMGPVDVQIWTEGTTDDGIPIIRVKISVFNLHAQAIISSHEDTFWGDVISAEINIGSGCSTLYPNNGIPGTCTTGNTILDGNKTAFIIDMRIIPEIDSTKLQVKRNCVANCTGSYECMLLCDNTYHAAEEMCQPSDYQCYIDALEILSECNHNCISEGSYSSDEIGDCIKTCPSGDIVLFATPEPVYNDFERICDFPLGIAELEDEYPSVATLKDICCDLNHIPVGAELICSSGYWLEGPGYIDGCNPDECFTWCETYLAPTLNALEQYYEDGEPFNCHLFSPYYPHGCNSINAGDPEKYGSCWNVDLSEIEWEGGGWIQWLVDLIIGDDYVGFFEDYIDIHSIMTTESYKVMKNLLDQILYDNLITYTHVIEDNSTELGICIAGCNDLLDDTCMTSCAMNTQTANHGTVDECIKMCTNDSACYDGCVDYCGTPYNAICVGTCSSTSCNPTLDPVNTCVDTQTPNTGCFENCGDEFENCSQACVDDYGNRRGSRSRSNVSTLPFQKLLNKVIESGFTGVASPCYYDPEYGRVMWGDMNGDTWFNVLDIVTLANCVLGENCGLLDNGSCGDMNQDGVYNILDVVILADCILAQNC